MGTEVDEFLAATMPRYNEAEIAIHNGDAAPRFATWSHRDPVTLFGAAFSGDGWAEIEPLFAKLGASLSNCTSYENEVLAAGASGDLAYIVALEHTTASVKGAPPQPYVLRVTTVFRREDGEWKVIHRHGDPATEGAVEMVHGLASAQRGHRRRSRRSGSSPRHRGTVSLPARRLRIPVKVRDRCRHGSANDQPWQVQWVAHPSCCGVRHRLDFVRAGGRGLTVRGRRRQRALPSNAILSSQVETR